MSALVAGVGVYCPAGVGLGALRTFVREGRRGHRTESPEIEARAMSRAALLACGAARSALAGSSGAGAACYLGVGASDVDGRDLDAVIAASLSPEGSLDFERFARRGVRAFNPLRTFQTLPNFTLCHAAMQEGITGPNAAHFSRGFGTLMALLDAVDALDHGASVALAGGADSAFHPLTLLEIGDASFEPGEAAVILRLERDGFARLDRAERTLEPERVSGATVLDGWSTSAVARLRPFAGDPCVDARHHFGHALAAAPALAWAIALAMLHEHSVVTCLHLGLDGEIAVVRWARA